MPVRRSTIKEAVTSAKSAPTRYEPEGMSVWLNVGFQYFKVADAESEEHADWYRRMLGEAIGKLIISDEITNLFLDMAIEAVDTLVPKLEGATSVITTKDAIEAIERKFSYD